MLNWSGETAELLEQDCADNLPFQEGANEFWVIPYLVAFRRYAQEIARDANVPISGSGFVTLFEVQNDFLADFQVHTVGEEIILSPRPSLIQTARLKTDHEQINSE